MVVVNGVGEATLLPVESDSPLHGSEQHLKGTPYLTPGDHNSEENFSKLIARSFEVRDRAVRVGERVSQLAQDLLGPFIVALRSELVAESNRIEGYDWAPNEVRRVVVMHRELLEAPIGSFMSAIRGDSRVYEALGLYRAHQLAEEWATGDRPREYELRALHSIIMAGEDHAGSYKSRPNIIGGSSHRTAEPIDVPRQMAEMCEWWRTGSGDPVLDATVVHAWLAHIHPFEDGNGRIARLLANLALSQSRYPPLILSSQADRGQYYDALAESDSGDILPLYDLFVRVLRRTVRTMSQPTYFEDLVNDRILSSISTKAAVWSQQVRQFSAIFEKEAVMNGWSIEIQGYPDVWSFSLLVNRDPDGNCWYLKAFDPNGDARWLLWFGYPSKNYVDLAGAADLYPSIFFSIRNDSPSAFHPFKHVSIDGVPDELIIHPFTRLPVCIRHGYLSDDHSLENASQLIFHSLSSTNYEV